MPARHHLHVTDAPGMLMSSIRAFATALMCATMVAPLTGQAAPRPDDVATVDGMIRAYYEVVSGPAGGIPDRERDRTLHHPDAWIAIAGVDAAGKPTLQIMDVDGYHDRTGQPRSEGFWEYEIHRTTRQYGNVVHVWSTYASATTPDGEPFTRGINSITLFHDGDRWWIMNWMFDSQALPIPSEYLPGG